MLLWLFDSYLPRVCERTGELRIQALESWLREVPHGICIQVSCCQTLCHSHDPIDDATTFEGTLGPSTKAFETPPLVKNWHTRVHLTGLGTSQWRILPRVEMHDPSEFLGFTRGRGVGGLAAVPPIGVQICQSSNMCGSFEAHADVNQKFSAAIVICDRWLEERAHECLRTHNDDVSPLTWST